jgi:hypothetical protein
MDGLKNLQKIYSLPYGLLFFVIFISGEYGATPRGEQLRQPEGAADGVAQARARALQGHRAGAHQRTAPAQKVITRVTVYR